MNFRDYRFSIMFLIFMMSEESHSHIRSKIFPDNEEISKSFAELLSSLVTVNQERVDALKKFFKLENLESSRQILRNGNNEDTPSITLLVIGQDEDPIINRIPIDRSKKHKKYNDEDSDSDSPSSSSDYSDEDRADLIENLRMHQVSPKRVIDEAASASSHEVISSENKPLMNDVLPSSSSKEAVLPKPAGRYCSSSSHNYGHCVYACKEAYRYACAHYSYCSSTLYRRLRDECRHSCKKRFYYYG